MNHITCQKLPRNKMLHLTLEIRFVDEMLDLHKRLAAVVVVDETSSLVHRHALRARRITGVRTDLYGLSGRRQPTVFLTPDLRSGGQAIKACPYIELYGLTDEEIAVVAGAT